MVKAFTMAISSRVATDKMGIIYKSGHLHSNVTSPEAADTNVGSYLKSQGVKSSADNKVPFLVALWLRWLGQKPLPIGGMR